MNLQLTEMEMLIVRDALNYYMIRNGTHELDAQTAYDVSAKIANAIKKKTSLEGKCGSCKWYDDSPESKKSIGSPCKNPTKEWRTPISMYKPRTCKACKKYERR